jgi:vacuolar-type H+-ATPase subunit D/Vma8
MEPTIEVKRTILLQQISGYANGIYLNETAYAVNKKLGNKERCAEIEKDLIRLQAEVGAWQAELNALEAEIAEREKKED